MPVAAGFKPIGLNGCCKNTIFLHFEEYEAIRLCDYEMKTQQEASVSMGVSRPTLSRIYVSARQKIAKALVRGVTIMIEGGAAYTDSEWFRCGACGFLFNNINPTLKIRKMECPVCHSDDLSASNININKNEIMMKIAIPTRDNVVDNHFGHCEYYTILTVGQNNQILSSETIPSRKDADVIQYRRRIRKHGSQRHVGREYGARCFKCTYNPPHQSYKGVFR